MLRIQRDAGSKPIFERETAAEIFTTSLSLTDRRLLVPVNCGSWLVLDSGGGGLFWARRWGIVLMNWCCRVTCPNWPRMNGFTDPPRLGSEVHKHALFFLFRLNHTCSKFLFLHKLSRCFHKHTSQERFLSWHRMERQGGSPLGWLQYEQMVSVILSNGCPRLDTTLTESLCTDPLCASVRERRDPCVVF